MKKFIEKKTTPILYLAAMALITVLTIFYINTQKVKSTKKSVDHTLEVLRKNDNLLLDVLNLETGSRGYLLTGNRTYLEPFYLGETSIYGHLIELDRLTSDNPTQQLRLDSLNEFVAKRIVLTKKVIEHRKQNKLSETEKLITIEKGKELVDKIRGLISAINSQELALLVVREKEAKAFIYYSELIFIILNCVIILILVFVGLLIKHQKSKDKFAEELKKSTELFSNLFNNTPASIWISRLTDGKIMNVNKSFLNLFGFASSKEVVGKTSTELKLFVDTNYEEKIADLLKNNETIVDSETNIRSKSGELKWISDSVLLLEVDNTLCLFSVSIDITHRKKAEEQLVAVNGELEAFTYSVSHDLRAPLRAINAYSKIIQEDYVDKLDADGICSLMAIQNNSKRMGNLIDDLLAFSRLGKKEVALSEINMTGLINTVREEETIDSLNEIEFDIRELLPAKGQQALIKQVCVNLISNAIKYSQHKLIINIEIGSYYEDNLVVYYVKDNGAGFDMKYYNKLFGVFQRLHSNEEFEGTGIGLAIVKKIVNRHSGKVWAESSVNEGSCFYFSLPTINS